MISNHSSNNNSNNNSNKQQLQSQQQQQQKLDFRIKLLSGNNVVLVEGTGYESEIFMPQVINGRICFQNIIPNRRCCVTSAATNAKLISRTWRMSAGQDNTTTGCIANGSPRLSPLAYSTPASAASTSQLAQKLLPGKNPFPRNRFERRGSTAAASELGSQSCATLPSPQAGRMAVPTPYEVVKDTLVQIPSGIKVIRLYREPTPGTPKRLGRICSPHTVFRQCNLNSGSSSPIRQAGGGVGGGGSSMTSHTGVTQMGNNSGFRLPATPEIPKPSPQRAVHHHHHNNHHRNTVNMPTESSRRKQVVVGPPASVTKWRKCITPQRTYSRRGTTNAGTAINRRTSVMSIKKSTLVRNGAKILPSYLNNPTQGTKASHKLDMRRRRLVIDPKVTISPASFKRQQKDTSDLKKETPSFQSLPKTRKQYIKSKASAFDMLTSGNRTSTRAAISSKLQTQFQKGCINKTATTYPKYKLLCTIPPLECDEETAELRRHLREQKQDKQQQQHQQRRKLSLGDVSVALEHATALALQKEKENRKPNSGGGGLHAAGGDAKRFSATST